MMLTVFVKSFTGQNVHNIIHNASITYNKKEYSVRVYSLIALCWGKVLVNGYVDQAKNNILHAMSNGALFHFMCHSNIINLSALL